jgi:hypothetical protein
MVLHSEFGMPAYGQTYDQCPKVRSAAFHYRTASVCSDDSVPSSYYSDNMEPQNYSVTSSPPHMPSDSELNLGKVPILGPLLLSFGSILF